MLAEVISLAGSDFSNANDQKLVADMFMARKHGIRVDYFAAVFQSMHMTSSPPLKDCDPFADLETVINESIPKVIAIKSVEIQTFLVGYRIREVTKCG